MKLGIKQVQACTR